MEREVRVCERELWDKDANDKLGLEPVWVGEALSSKLRNTDGLLLGLANCARY